MAKSTPPAEQQGLVRREALVPEVITTPAELEQTIHIWTERRLNLLLPLARISHIPASHQLVAVEVKLDPNPQAGDVYTNTLFCKGGEVAITKAGLSKLAQCAGMSITPRRLDDRRIQFYWEYEATAEFLGFDGMPQRITASKEWDLRDGSFRLKGFSASQIEQARANGQANAESRAINRVIRQFLSLKQKYHTSELQAAFGLVRMQWVPDYSNPVIAAAVTQTRLGAGASLYGGGLPALPAGDPPADIASMPVNQRPVQHTTLPPESDNDHDGDDLPFEDAGNAKQGEVLFTITRIARERNGQPFINLRELGDEKIYVGDELSAHANATYKAGQPVPLEWEIHGSQKWLKKIGGR